MTKLSTLLDEVDAGTVLLPEFQRGYVWNRDQVRGLLRSLYRGYPVGSLLMWETAADRVSVRGGVAGGGIRNLLLDGQQRITSLYGVLRGTQPPFFEGNAEAFLGLHFNVDSEEFAFYQPSRMKGDRTWVDVSALFNSGLGPFFAKFQDQPEKASMYLERLNALTQIRDKDFNIEKVARPSISVDEVVDIFNKVNSGGTKLSRGDLALARICAEWPEARQTMRNHLNLWSKEGYNFTLDWLLRNITGLAVQKSEFSYLEGVKAPEFRASLKGSVDNINLFLDTAAARLGLDHDKVLMGRYAVPVINLLLSKNGGTFADKAQQDKVLYWYINAALWGRFGGSVESMVAKDYENVRQGGIDNLIKKLRLWRGGSLTIKAEDFTGSTQGSRFYPMLYLLTRTAETRDLRSGATLRDSTSNSETHLELHHIFPKALLRGKFDRSEVNAIANFCFVAPDTTAAYSKRAPADYLQEIADDHPGVLESQWIPTDPTLWSVDRYPEFLKARRRLLATAAQEFMKELLNGTLPDTGPIARRDQPAKISDTEDLDDPRTGQIRALIAELTDLGASKPLTDTEINDPDTGVPLAVAEAYWPDGLQPGIGEPLVLELDPEDADLPRLAALGYKVFTSIDSLRDFGQKDLNRGQDEHTVELYVERDGRHRAPDPDPDGEPGDVAAVDRASGQGDPLEFEFTEAMIGICERSRKEVRYNPTQLRAMIAALGGVAAAHQILQKPTVTDGFSVLWEKGRLDLTVESLVVSPRFSELLPEDDIQRARDRLSQFDAPKI